MQVSEGRWKSRENSRLVVLNETKRDRKLTRKYEILEVTLECHITKYSSLKNVCCVTPNDTTFTKYSVPSDAIDSSTIRSTTPIELHNRYTKYPCSTGSTTPTIPYRAPTKYVSGQRNFERRQKTRIPTVPMVKGRGMMLFCLMRSGRDFSSVISLQKVPLDVWVAGQAERHSF